MTNSVVIFKPVVEADFESMVAIRIAAMRESLERLGRFDPARARERLRAGFLPDRMQHIDAESSERIGFVTLKTEGQDALRLDHLYVLPAYQGKSIGTWVMAWVKSQATAVGKSVLVTVLKQSDAIRFYEKHSFQLIGEEEWDLHYKWQPVRSVL